MKRFKELSDEVDDIQSELKDKVDELQTLEETLKDKYRETINGNLDSLKAEIAEAKDTKAKIDSNFEVLKNKLSKIQKRMKGIIITLNRLSKGRWNGFLDHAIVKNDETLKRLVNQKERLDKLIVDILDHMDKRYEKLEKRYLEYQKQIGGIIITLNGLSRGKLNGSLEDVVSKNVERLDYLVKYIPNALSRLDKRLEKLEERCLECIM